MNLRKEWSNTNSDNVLDRFYSREETVNEVIENFDIRRKYSAEGEELKINGQVDWCLVQTSSNPLKELDDLRKIHCPMSMKVNRGDYVEYENDIWLVDTNVVNVADAYQSTRISRCSYVLKWQNSTGEIIERPIVSYNASAYNTGVTGNNTIQIGSDQLMILIPFDEETKSVTRGKKFFIDNNMEDPMTYELTRPDRTTYVFGGIGYIQWLVSECAYSPTEKELELGVCDYKEITTEDTSDPENPDEMTDLSAVIKGSTSLKLTYPRTYTATIADSNDNEVPWDNTCSWNVISEFDIEQSIDGNKIELYVENEGLIDEKFKLQVLINGIVNSEIIITIASVF